MGSFFFFFLGGGGGVLKQLVEIGMFPLFLTDLHRDDNRGYKNTKDC